MLGRRKLKRVIVVCSAAASLAVSGCTTRLEVVPLEAAKTTETRGLVYYLPVGTIDITLVGTLVDCVGTDMTFDVGTDTAVKYGPDRDRPLLINYEELNNWFKKTSLKATLNEDGTLKSLDSELSDKTGAVIGNIGKSAVNVAKMPVSALAPGAEELAKEEVCNQKTRESIAQRNKLRRDIAEKEVEVTKLPTNKQASARQEIDRLRGQLAPHEAFLQATSKHPALKPDFSTENAQSHCPADGTSVWSTELKPEADIAARWIDEKSPASEEGKAAMTVYVRAVPIADGALVAQSTESAGRSPLYYRQPGPVKQTLAHTDPKNAGKCLDIATTTYLLPQAGMVVLLPLENGIFDSNVLRASFHPSGGLLTFEYVTESQAEAASATMAAITGSGSEIATEARTADTLRLETQVKELELRQKLRTLRQQENSVTNSSGATP